MQKFHRWVVTHKLGLKLIGLILLSAALLSLPFINYYFGWLSPLGLLPFLYLLKILQDNKVKKTLGYWWLVGFLSQIVVLVWMLQTQPERWAGATGWSAIGGLVFGYVAFALVMSAGFVLAGWLYKLSKVNLQNPWVFIVLPAAWVIGEFSRSWLFSIISAGPNTTFGPFWNFGSLGFAASVTPLVFLARLVGLWGLSFVVVVVNLIIFWLIQKRWKLPIILLAVIMLATAISWFVYKNPTGKTINVATVQFGNNDSLQIGGVNFHQDLLQKVQGKRADMLVLPEYSDIFLEDQTPTDKDMAATLLTSQDSPIITSTQTQNSEGDSVRHNTLTVYNTAGNVVHEQDKQFLIPIGEAMPYAFIYLFRAIGQGQVIDSQFQGREVTKNPHPDTAYSVSGLNIGSLACSGAIGPELYRGLVGGGAEILTNSASLSIFSGAPTYHQQAQQMARFIAVANARPFVQATDGSYSFITDQNGRWLAKSGQNSLELLIKNVQLNNTKTIYSLLGEWVVLASTLSIGVIIFVNNKKS